MTAKVQRPAGHVAFIPEDTEPLRDVAVRVRPRQGERFADGTAVKHFAVLSNRWDWDGARLIPWHREKAGTMEHVHAVVKNEWAGGVWPCGRFGANAAWLRLAWLAHTVLTAFKRLALPPERLMARPKRLRFLLFTVPGRLITHARQLWLRLACLCGTRRQATTRDRLAQWREAVHLLPAPSYARTRSMLPLAFRPPHEPGLSREAQAWSLRPLGGASGRPDVVVARHAQPSRILPS